MNDRYTCLTRNEFIYDHYKLVAVRKSDILLIKAWRNAQINVLRQKHILTDLDQKTYFRKNVFPYFKSQHPPQILFSYLQNNVLIGYGGLVHINWDDRRAEVSFLLDPGRIPYPRQYAEDFLSFLELIKNIAFAELHLNRIFTETFETRSRHIALLEKSGFQFEGRLKKHILLGDQYVDSAIHGYLKDTYDQE
jgi:RimJ/RimL family protein N-acetyltransferase